MTAGGWGSEHQKTGVSHCFTITGAPFCGDPRVKASGELSQRLPAQPCKLCVHYRTLFLGQNTNQVTEGVSR